MWWMLPVTFNPIKNETRLTKSAIKQALCARCHMYVNVSRANVAVVFWFGNVAQQNNNSHTSSHFPACQSKTGNRDLEQRQQTQQHQPQMTTTNTTTTMVMATETTTTANSNSNGDGNRNQQQQQQPWPQPKQQALIMMTML